MPLDGENERVSDWRSKKCEVPRFYEAAFLILCIRCLLIVISNCFQFIHCRQFIVSEVFRINFLSTNFRISLDFVEKLSVTNTLFVGQTSMKCDLLRTPTPLLVRAPASWYNLFDIHKRRPLVIVILLETWLSQFVLKRNDVEEKIPISRLQLPFKATFLVI